MATEMRRNPCVDYYKEWQFTSAKLADAKKRIAALTTATMGADNLPIKAREMFASMYVLATAACAHYRRVIAEQSPDSPKLKVLQGQLENALKWAQALAWFSEMDQR